MADTGGVALDRYDFESRYADLAEGRMHYVAEGEGPTLLMVHGNPTWSYLYRHMIHGLRDRFHCVAMDHLGFGLSDKPPDADYGISGHVRRFGEFIEAAGMKKFTLVVQDWGGPIALDWAVNHKEQLERLVILNTVASAPRAEDMELYRMGAVLLIAAIRLPVIGELTLRRLNLFVRRGIAGATVNRKCLTREVMKGYLFPHPDYASRAAILKFPREIPLTSRHPNWRRFDRIESGLRGWQVPTRIIWALNDPVFSVRLARRFEQMLPNHAPTVELQKVGHFLQEEAPEPIVKAIREFFTAA